MNREPMGRRKQGASQGRQGIGTGIGPGLLLLGATLGAWSVARYGHRLLRQPRLRLPTVPPEQFQTALEINAQLIAAANLRAGIERRRLPDGTEKLVLCAGLRNFREPWARDFGFASFGLLEIGEANATRDCLEVFLLTQRPSGQFPVKVHSTSVANRYLHSLLGREQPVHAPIRPKYQTAHGTVSLDGNALLIIAAENYVTHTGDQLFARRYWPQLRQAIAWLETHALGDDRLLHQAAYADWADSIARAGKILYVNVLYWKALTAMCALAALVDRPQTAQDLADKATAVRAAINHHFWRAELGYYVTSELFDNLSSGGNLLAVAWGLADAQQATQILDRMQEFGMSTPVPTQTVHRAYPRRFIALENRLGGIPHYHTSAAWLWLGSWHVIALARCGRLPEAEETFCRMAEAIVRDGTVHEVYDVDGHFLSTFWYTSEAPLTWSAGMAVHAYHELMRLKAGQT